MFKVVMIAAGGAVGAMLRYAVSGWAQKLTAGSFPMGTFVVNLIGCFLIGLAGALFAGPHLVREEYRVALLVGLLGAFTTFSTFGWETFALANAGQMGLAAVNVLVSNGVGLVAVWIGYRLGATWFGA
ncbi:MAG: fluoride efflux transporter CrcB [Planctomycetes bacterium]|nr:fluoride efflux transporter CrcB [Planctomycetota bacterium]